MKRALLVLLFLFTSSAYVYSADLGHYFYERTTEHSDYGGDRATEGQNITAKNKVSQDLMAVSDSSDKRKDGSKGLPAKPEGSVGIETSVIKNVKTTNLPLSYGFPVNFAGGDQEFLDFKLKIPYTKREQGDFEESGLGDITLKTDYMIKYPKLLFNTAFLVKFATGEFEDADVPLGTGSTDYGLSFNLKKYFDNYSLKAGFGYVLTGDYSQSGSTAEYGDEIVVSGGGEYDITDTISLGGEFIYNYHNEDVIESSGFEQKFPGLTTCDFIPSITYLIKIIDLRLNLKAVVPVYDSWTGGSGSDPEDPERDFEIKFKILKPF